MSRTVLLCVLFCVLGACESHSPASRATPSITSSPITGHEHLACAGDDGLEIGQRPLPVLDVEDRTLPAHYGFGYRAYCPWLVEEGSDRGLVAIDGVPFDEMDVEVASGTGLSVSVIRWSDDITVDYFRWNGLDGSGEQREESPIDVESGVWRLDVPAQPGEYGLSFGFHWEYGEDDWFWNIRVVD